MALAQPAIPDGPGLQEQLLREGPAALAEEAMRLGHAGRGAIVFYRPELACVKCHSAGDGAEVLGPDLAEPAEGVSGAHLAEALLRPSKVIREGFEAVVVVTSEGRTVTGLVVEDGRERLVVREPEVDGKLITIETSEIEERSKSGVSIMPEGLVDQLAGRGAFLDLLRYLIEIAEGGPERARQLRPAGSLYATRPLPEYESDVDHAGMIRDWDDEAFDRGRAIYERLCINCHGTHARAGSLPTSLRFATGKFKNGSDPYGMYRTLTHGYGMMVAQAWMVPQQKYDVIHYIREAYLRESNPSQYVAVDDAYLAGLPQGSTRGPEPVESEPWVDMDYGPSLIATYEIGRDGSNFAYKGIAVRLDAGPGGVSRGRYWTVFDHDTLRVAGAWSGEQFIDYAGIMFNGAHEVHPHVVGQVHLANPIGPGWGNPEDGSFDDPRLRGRDGRPYGPLPRAWAHYKGLYHFGDQTIVSYTVGETSVLELPGLYVASTGPVFTRLFNIGPRRREMVLQVAQRDGAAGSVESVRREDLPLAPLGKEGSEVGRALRYGLLAPAAPTDERATARDGPPARPSPTRGEGAFVNGYVVAGAAPLPDGAKWEAAEGGLRLHLSAGEAPLRFTVWIGNVASRDDIPTLLGALDLAGAAMDLAPLTHGGPPRWPERIAVQPTIGSDDGPFAVDDLAHPAENPWLCRVRPTGFDFLPGGETAAVCTWDGDVWLARGIDRPEDGVTWQRVASGLFQPLGLKVLDDEIYVTCRDQIVILRDLNGDGETDFYENFNNDHQVTEHFHEFAMGLQTDAAGSFYYAKSARHAKKALVPHHGTLLRVSPDGARTEIVATGFRAANGVCANADGTFFVTDQEGHWNPKNRINWVKPGGFYGNMWGYHNVSDTSDAAMEQPLCWITNRFDRSPSELVRVESDAWEPLKGTLLNFSYGYGKVYVVPYEFVDGQPQGGMVALPIPQFPTGIMRGRFHPESGQLYTCGMFSWAGDRQQPGGFYRIRSTGKPLHVPVGLEARREGMRLRFTGTLDRETAEDAANYAVRIWSLKRSARYGSDHYDEKTLAVTAASLAEDGTTVMLRIPEIAPTWCMEVKYSLAGTSGEPVEGVVHNTIHRLGVD